MFGIKCKVVLQDNLAALLGFGFNVRIKFYPLNILAFENFVICIKPLTISNRIS